jgi:hypothetical protein
VLNRRLKTGKSQVASGTKIGFKFENAGQRTRQAGFCEGYEGVTKACAFEPQASSASGRFVARRDQAGCARRVSGCLRSCGAMLACAASALACLGATQRCVRRRAKEALLLAASEQSALAVRYRPVTSRELSSQCRHRRGLAPKESGCRAARWKGGEPKGTKRATTAREMAKPALWTSARWKG